MAFNKALQRQKVPVTLLCDLVRMILATFNISGLVNFVVAALRILVALYEAACKIDLNVLHSEMFDKESQVVKKPGGQLIAVVKSNPLKISPRANIGYEVIMDLKYYVNKTQLKLLNAAR